MGLAATLFLASGTCLFAQGTAIPTRPDIGRAPALFAANCSSCHDWAKSYEGIIESGVIVPGKSEESPAWLALSQDVMPPTGPLGEDDKALIMAWIQAGAPRPATGEAGGSAAARTSASFLGFADKQAFHRFSGWASGGLLLAAGVVGAVHAYDMMSTAHDYRDSHGIEEFSASSCDPEIALVWNSGAEQALRWTHVGLLAAGESFYLANAVTGTSFMGKLPSGWSKAKIHRYAFFIHGGLMLAEGVLGFVSSDALRRGDHDTFHNLLIAHAGLGIAIPVIILGAGTIMDPGLKL